MSNSLGSPTLRIYVREIAEQVPTYGLDGNPISYHKKVSPVENAFLIILFRGLWRGLASIKSNSCDFNWKHVVHCTNTAHRGMNQTLPPYYHLSMTWIPWGVFDNLVYKIEAHELDPDVNKSVSIHPKCSLFRSGRRLRKLLWIWKYEDFQNSFL